MAVSLSFRVVILVLLFFAILLNIIGLSVRKWIYCQEGAIWECYELNDLNHGANYFNDEEYSDNGTTVDTNYTSEITTDISADTTSDYSTITTGSSVITTGISVITTGISVITTGIPVITTSKTKGDVVFAFLIIGLIAMVIAMFMELLIQYSKSFENHFLSYIVVTISLIIAVLALVIGCAVYDVMGQHYNYSFVLCTVTTLLTLQAGVFYVIQWKFGMTPEDEQI